MGTSDSLSYIYDVSERSGGSRLWAVLIAPCPGFPYVLLNAFVLIEGHDPHSWRREFAFHYRELLSARAACASCFSRFLNRLAKSKPESPTLSNPTLANGTREWGHLYMGSHCRKPKREEGGPPVRVESAGSKLNVSRSRVQDERLGIWLDQWRHTGAARLEEIAIARVRALASSSTLLILGSKKIENKVE